jgi:hypothetical protein
MDSTIFTPTQVDALLPSSTDHFIATYSTVEILCYLAVSQTTFEKTSP